MITQKSPELQAFLNNHTLLLTNPAFIPVISNKVRKFLTSRRSPFRRYYMNKLIVGSNVTVNFRSSRKNLSKGLCSERTITNMTREFVRIGILKVIKNYNPHKKSKQNPLGQEANTYILSGIFLIPEIRKALADILPFLKAPSIQMLIIFGTLALSTTIANNSSRSASFQQQFNIVKTVDENLSEMEWDDDSRDQLAKLGVFSQSVFLKKEEGGCVQAHTPSKKNSNSGILKTERRTSMSGQFSAEIERLAEKFKMTVAGKIRLAGFSDLILTTAYSRLLKKNTHQEIRTPFLMYFKTCEFAASDLHIPYNNDKVQKLCQQFGIHNILREDYTTPEGRNTWPITGKHQIVEQKKAQSQAKYASLAAEQEAYFEAHGIPQEGLPSRQPGNEWAIGLHDNEIIAECVKLRTTFQGPLFGKPLASNKVPLDVPLPEHKRNFTPTEVDLIIWFRQLERNVRAQFPKLPEEYVKINELINNRSDILETFLTNMKEFYEQTNSSV